MTSKPIASQCCMYLSCFFRGHFTRAFHFYTFPLRTRNLATEKRLATVLTFLKVTSMRGHWLRRKTAQQRRVRYSREEDREWNRKQTAHTHAHAYKQAMQTRTHTGTNAHVLTQAPGNVWLAGTGSQLQTDGKMAPSDASPHLPVGHKSQPFPWATLLQLTAKKRQYKHDYATIGGTEGANSTEKQQTLVATGTNISLYHPLSCSLHLALCK